MTRFPDEFEALLSLEGRRVLEGTHPSAGALARGNFCAVQGLLDPGSLPALAQLLDATFKDMLVDMVRELPPPNLSKAAFHDTLPKVGRSRSVPFESIEGQLARQVFGLLGLKQMLESASYHRFCCALTGLPLSPLSSSQVLCNRAGDYAGPHTDHMPDDPGIASGYVDVHLTFCTPGVRAQHLVYARDGHLNAIEPIAVSGGITAYRLPLWHYTTPLETETADARRWLVLSSFMLKK